MRKIRLFVLGIASFLTVTCSSFLQRAIALTMCGILGINSPACYLLGNRVNAAVPPVSSEATLIAENIDIFSPDGGGTSPPPPTDIFAPPNPQTRPPSGGDDIFAPPNSTQPNQQQVNNDSLSGIWLYSIYTSPLDQELFLRTAVEIIQNGDDAEVSLCQGNCNKIQSLQTNIANKIPQEQSLRAEYGNITIETVESTDGEAIWGEISDANQGDGIYFVMEKQTQYDSLSYIKKNTKNTDILFKQNSMPATSSWWPDQIYTASGSGDMFGKVSSSLKQLVQTTVPTSNVSSASQVVNPVTAVESVDNNAAKNAIRQNARNLVEQAQKGIRTICDGANLLENRYAKLPTKDLYARGLCGFNRLPSASRNLLRSSTNLRTIGKIALRGARIARIGLRVAGRLAIPLMLLDLGLTAYEFCVNNPGTCERIGENIAQAVGLKPSTTSQPTQQQDLGSTSGIGKEIKNLAKGTSYGDPHMITFDGFKYSFQTVGEFTLVKSTNGNFEVQARQGSMSNSVSMNTAVAMKIGNSRVALYAKNLPDSDTNTPLRIDGKPIKLENGTLELPGGGTIQGDSSYYLITSPTGEQIGVTLGNGRMDITPYIAGESGQYIGLLGNANGDPADDLRTRSGKVIPTKENSTYGLISEALSNLLPVPAPLSQAEKIFFDIVYKEFGDSWRISQAESLFDYPPGKDTGTFTNRSFPNSYLSLNSLLPPQIRKAEEICRQAGVESELMDGCIFDVANTGDASFAESAANALLDKAKDRLLQQLRNKIPSLPVRIPGLPF